MKYKTILVTGAAGFIGKTVVNTLLAHNYQVVAMIRPHAISPFVPNSRLKILWADILDYNSFSNHLERVDAVVHLAANKYHPYLSYEVNIQGAKNLVKLLKQNKLQNTRLINISSQSTKIKHMGVYGKSKLESDTILEGSPFDWTTLKPSLVYGNEEGTLLNIIANYIKTLPFVPVIGDGKWELYPLAVDDLAETIIQVLHNDTTIGKTYDVGCSQKVRFDKLIKVLQQQLNISKKIVHIPFFVGLGLVFVAKKFIPSLPLSIDNVLGSNQNTYCNPKPAIRELKIHPLSLEQGVQKYFARQSQSLKKLRVAVVGLGKMGILHSTILNTIPHVQIAAIIDTDVQLINTVRSMGIEAAFYSSLTDAFNNESFECVYICTPTFAHKEIINICLKKKIPFFVEKPVFNSYKDFEQLFKKIKTIPSAVGYNSIFKREVQFTKKLLEKNTIGKVLRYKMYLKHSEVFGPKKGWTFQKKLSGGGVLINPGPHAFSIIEFLFKKGRVESADLKYLYKNEVEDEATVRLDHPTGIKGELQASWSVPNCPVLTIEFEVIGEKGKIVFENNKLIVDLHSSKKKIYPIYDLPAPHAVFNLNPRSGGASYYFEDFLFTNAVINKKSVPNNLMFAYQLETLIHQAYEKAV